MVAIGVDNQAAIKTREKLRFGAGRHSVKKDRIIGACEELRRRRSDVTLIIRLAPKGHRKQGRWMRRQADRKGDFEKVDREYRKENLQNGDLETNNNGSEKEGTTKWYCSNCGGEKEPPQGSTQ